MLFLLGTVFGIVGLWMLASCVRRAEGAARRAAWRWFVAGATVAVLGMWAFFASRRPEIYSGAMGLAASLLAHSAWLAFLVLRARARSAPPAAGPVGPPLA